METGACLFEAENVVMGLSAMGRPSVFGPLPIPKDHVNVCNAATLARRVMAVLADDGDDSFLPDALRTAIHFKILAYVSKQGRALHYPDTLLMARRIGMFLVDHPRAITGKAGWARLDAMANQYEAEQARRLQNDRISHFREVSGAPERRTVWTGGIDGRYRLEELSHPFHLWEEGQILGNCLGAIAPGAPEPKTPHDLPRLHYWKQHQRGLKLYALRDRHHHLGVVSLDGRLIQEFHLSAGLTHVPPRIWREINAFLTSVHGRLGHGGKGHDAAVCRLLQA